jgi:diguanylate cyclase (GGDEF)-like protein
VQAVWRAPRELPHDNVSAIVQTRDGYVWIGTVDGLARFDGVRSIVYSKANTPEIRNNWIRSLLADRHDRLWIGTFGGGLVCLEEGRFVPYGRDKGLPEDVILSMFEDASGLLVGAEAGGVYRLRGGSFVREPGTEPLARSSVRAMEADAAGGLWIGTEAGLFHRAPGAAAFERAAGLPDDAIISLEATKEGLYAGTEHGLARIAGGTTTSFTTREGLSHPRVWSLRADSDGNLWIGTDGGGLDRLTNGVLSSFSTRNGLTNDFVWSIFEDREKSLWVGTNGGGVNQLRNGRVVTLTTREGLPSDFVWSVLRVRDGSLLVGTEDGGVARVRDGMVTCFATFQELHDRVRALAEDTRGRIWIGTDQGLFWHEGGRLHPARIAGLEGARYFAIAVDHEGAVWVATKEGVDRIEGGRIVETMTGDAGPVPNASAILIARDGAPWVSSSSGLWHREAGGFVAYTREHGLPSDYVTAVLETPDGVLWAATRGGLARLRGGRFDAVTVKEGLPDDAVMSAAIADDGSLWYGTNRGLFQVPLAELTAAADGVRRPLHVRAVGLDDGMRSLEVNHSGSARLKEADGRLWFATRAGLVSVPPVSSEAPFAPPPVRIEEATADGRLLAGPPPWRLPAGTLRLDVHFTALAFRSPSAIRMRHRLDGFDLDWVDAGADRTAHYTSLPHGRYTLRVIAAGPDGVWSKDATAAIEIAPRLHETLWFRLLAGLLVLVAVPVFYLARLRLLRRQKAELERLVAERTAEVAAANERLAQLVREDALTGVASRRRFDEALEEEWRRAQRMGHPLGLVLVDVDAFKAFNDRLGHPAGDACLRAVAAAVASASQRAGELAARYGGEEFALLLPGATVDGAQAVAENVRERVEALAIAHPDSGAAAVVTVSVGVVVRTPAPESAGPEELVAAADQALYAAKQIGRNRVEFVA